MSLPPVVYTMYIYYNTRRVSQIGSKVKFRSFASFPLRFDSVFFTAFVNSVFHHSLPIWCIYLSIPDHSLTSRTAMSDGFWTFSWNYSPLTAVSSNPNMYYAYIYSTVWLTSFASTICFLTLWSLNSFFSIPLLVLVIGAPVVSRE